MREELTDAEIAWEKSTRKGEEEEQENAGRGKMEKPTPGEWNGHTAKEWSLALQGLTPGGSEYASDPDRCVATVRDSYADLHRCRIDRVKLQRQTTLLPEMAEALREAVAGLEAFAAGATWDTIEKARAILQRYEENK